VSSAARNEAALYHRRGWCPIPVKERSKATSLVQLAPYLKRRATKEELNAWTWNGVGIVTGPLSGLLVLDVDGERGEEKLKELGHPPTPMVRTAGGGLHLYFKHPGEDVRTGIRVAPELDVKASGGYVVAPPSLGANGRRYEWIISPEEAEVADPPEWIMRLLERPRRSGAAPPVGKKIPSGSRNQELASIAGTMRRRGMEEPEILAALQTANELRCEPPLEAEEVEKIASSVARYAPARPAKPAQSAGDVVSFNGHSAAQPPRRRQFTDLDNAERFVDAHSSCVLWCPARKSFLVWDGKRYEWDDRGEAVKLAHQTARGIHNEAADAESADAQKAITKWALASQNESRINAMLSQSKPYLAVGMEELDRDPWLINCQNGTLDLRTGKLNDHDPADRITKIVPVEYDPEAPCPRFLRFLKETLLDDAVIEFVKRYSGYTLTGITRERLLAILYGFGKNGKTTLIELLHEALGDYARNTDVETLLIKKYQGVGNDVAALKGARFVSAAEVEKGRRLAESKVKQLTGRDTVTARFLFGENFDFKPEFKLWLSTNNKPVIQGTDDAIWDRLRLIPFTQRFEGTTADPKLPDKLRAELPGVFAWMVAGCLEWQEHGLEEPEKVTEATLQYRAEMDTLAAFIEDRCVLGTTALAPATPLYKQYQKWCDDAGEKPETQKMFGMRLSERGFESTQISRGPHKGRRGWLGIGIRVDDADPNGGLNFTNDAGTRDTEGHDHLPSGPLVDDRLPSQNADFAGNSSDMLGGVDHSRPKNQNLPHSYPREEKDSEKRSTSSTSSTEASGWPGDGGNENRSEGLEKNSQTHHDPEGLSPDVGEDLEGLDDFFEEEDGGSR
jgi:putative DNA primase/helicase